MKKIILISCFIFSLIYLGTAQTGNDSLLLQSYVFPNFMNGSVHSKSGEVNEALLNYCAYYQSIVFKTQEGPVMILTGLEKIDTIYIAGKKFIPVGNVVYEVMDGAGKVALLVTYKSKMVPWTATADHNGSSRKQNDEVSNTVSNVYVNRVYKGDFSLLTTKHYWLKDYNKVYKVNNLKDFLKAFKESAGPEIHGFAKRNYIDFTNEADLIKLVDFCNSK